MNIFVAVSLTATQENFEKLSFFSQHVFKSTRSVQASYWILLLACLFVCCYWM